MVRVAYSRRRQLRLTIFSTFVSPLATPERRATLGMVRRWWWWRGWREASASLPILPNRKGGSKGGAVDFPEGKSRHFK